MLNTQQPKCFDSFNTFIDYSQAVLFIQVFTKFSLTIKDYINLKFENTI